MSTKRTTKKKSDKDPGYWLEAVNDLSTSFNLASRDIDVILKLIARKLVKELGAHAVAIWTVEEKTNFMKIEASVGLNEGYVRYFNQTDRIRIGKGFVGKVMVGKKTLYTTNTKDENLMDIKRWRDIVVEEGFTALIVAPMFVGKKIVGSFNIYYKKPVREFNPYQILFIESIANQVAVTIENIKGYNTIKTYGDSLFDQVEKLLYLQKITESLSLSFHKSTEESLTSFAKYITGQFDAIGISIFEREKETDILNMTFSHGLSSYHISYLKEHPKSTKPGTIAGLAFTKRKVETSIKVFVDSRIDKHWRTLLSIEKISAKIALPLYVGDEGIGVLVVYYQKPHIFSKEEIGILSTLAHYIGISLQNIHIFDSLASERKKMAHMINSLNDGLIVYDLEERISAFNPQASEFLWVYPEDVVNKTSDELDVKKNSLLSNIKSISSLVLSDFEKREISITDPENRIFEITMVPLIGEKKRREGSMRIIHDITKEKEAESLKSNFVAVAGHQLRTPLTGIKWVLDSLAKGNYGEVNSTQQKYIAEGSKSADKLIKIVGDLLDASRLEEKRFSYSITSIDIYQIVKEIYNSFLATVKEGKENFNYTLEKPKTKFPLVKGDSEKLKMALQNIIDNAIKYTKKTGEIHVSLRKSGKSIIIDIQDNGIGIPREEQKFLFKRFFRASNAILFRTDGSGLGLFIANEIITRHNGKILIDSKKNKGTTVSVVLPLDRETK